MNSLRVLFVGWLAAGTTSLQRFHTLQSLGHSVTGIDLTSPQMSWLQSLTYRVSGKLFRMGLDVFGSKDVGGKNAAVVRALREDRWDVLWIEKGLTIQAATLTEARRLLPKCRILGFSRDDMYARHNQSRSFLASLPLYDVYFTTKSYGVKELKSLGAKEVHFVDNSYDPSTHRPMAVSPDDRERFGGPVGFVGDYEIERRRSIEFLATHGVPVRVWGPEWPSKSICRGVRVELSQVWGDDYALAICAFDINLGFLRKINRDLQTGRSVEIPACGAFMLAERTDEHQALFEEGREAEYFDSDEELLDKVRYYLSHEDDRKRIASAGRERCIQSGYSNEARLARMLETAMKEL